MPRHQAMTGQQGYRHCLIESQCPQHAVAAAKTSLAAAAFANFKSLQLYRETPLKDLGIGQT